MLPMHTDMLDCDLHMTQIVACARHGSESEGKRVPLQDGGTGDAEKAGAAAPTEAADFLLEIGTEEIPPAELTAVLQQLRDKAAALLADLRLGHGGVDVQGTPRRLTVRVAALAPRQEAVSEERRGPPRKRAYDDDGNPTKALLGFCRGCGVDAGSVFFQADKKVRGGCRQGGDTQASVCVAACAVQQLWCKAHGLRRAAHSVCGDRRAQRPCCTVFFHSARR